MKNKRQLDEETKRKIRESKRQTALRRSNMVVKTNFVPTDGREVKLEDWQKYQVDPRRCSVFS